MARLNVGQVVMIAQAPGPYSAITPIALAHPWLWRSPWMGDAGWPGRVETHNWKVALQARSNSPDEELTRD